MGHESQDKMEPEMTLMDELLPSNSATTRLDEDICIHIFSGSAAMIGVCLTVIGIFQIGRLQEIGSFADNLLAIDAMFFLSSCLLAYIALRTRARKRRHALEKVADSIFIAGMGLMAAVCMSVAYELL